MNEKVINYQLSENIITRISDYIEKEFIQKNIPLEKVACVFGGRRPALFLKRELSRRIKKSFIPPKVFSMDEFIDFIAKKEDIVKPVSDMDACYYIYTLAKKEVPGLLKGRERFCDFLPWAREIISFIEQLDLEAIQEKQLKNIQKSAAIGYEIPQNINRLLQNIVKLRSSYHNFLREKNVYSRGMRYLKASKSVEGFKADEFDAILFCNFYYLHSTEQKVIKSLMDKKKGVCFFQGSQDDWSVLSKNAKYLETKINPSNTKEHNYDVTLHQGFDMHSQVSMVREVLGKIKDKEKTVVVLPQPEAVVPLLCEISSCVDEMNVSLGYPLKRSSLYVLFDLLFKVQESKKENLYYAKDYLNLLKHPLVKNLKINSESAVTRVLVHKIEELLQGVEETSIGGKLFLSLAEIEDEKRVISRTVETLASMNIQVSISECSVVLGQLHRFLFKEWEEIGDISALSQKLSDFLDILVQKSIIAKFPFNTQALERLFIIADDFQSTSFCEERFSQQELWELFHQRLESERITFIGSPLRGLQVLGLLETRSLSFDNVIVMDMNESILPKLKIYEPLIPREVMLSLGLNRLEKEEEIQRYQFFRLLSCAKDVHLVYSADQIHEKSRFIEELLWAKQKEEGALKSFPTKRARFALETDISKKVITKTPEMVLQLKEATYSASRLNVYLGCPMQFYYKYVLGLKEKDDLLESPEATHIGKFIHEVLEDSFKRFINKKPKFDKIFYSSFQKLIDKKFEKEIACRMKSDSILLREIMNERLRKFLENEEQWPVKKILGLEEDRRATIKLNGKDVSFVYTVDRVDELEDGSIVIIDYKTGGANVTPKRLSSLQSMRMDRESIKDDLRSFQLPLYYHFTKEQMPNAEINAQLYNIRSLKRESFIRDDDKGKESEIMDISMKALEYIHKEICNPKVPFSCESVDDRRCQNCPFTGLCK